MKFLCLLLLICNLSLFAQQQAPRLMASLEEKETPIQLSKIDVNVKILGEIAETRTTMTFYNPNERVLEGKLSFPLPEGVVISGYALDIDGIMVDGVAVEKHQARRVFEREERKGIDPGLVELTKGNSFRTRIYPIPAKGSRTVMVRYISELPSASEKGIYRLPLYAKETIPQLHLRIEVVQASSAPAITPSVLDNFSFKASGKSYVAETTLENATVPEDLVVTLPDADHRKVWVEKSSEGKYHFVICDRAAAAFVPQTGASPQPSRIRLYWDASGSRQNADHAREFALIQRLFERWKTAPVSVDLILFSNRAEDPRQFTIVNGNVQKLLDVLQKTSYDGGTQLAAITPPINSIVPNYYLLFTDGLSNFGDEKPAGFKAPLYIFSTSPAANHSFLSWLALKAQGEYFNLERLDDKAVAGNVGVPAYRFMSADYNHASIQDTYPRIPETIYGRFILAGELTAPQAEITLKFGARGRVLKTVKYVVRQQESSAGNLLETVWAQKKIQDLSIFPDSNQKDLTALGMQYGLVTPRTSLLVLERVEQYVHYKITPPESLPEMRKEYLEQMAETQEDEKETKADGLEHALQLWNERVQWWKTDFSKIPKREPNKPTVAAPNASVVSSVPSASSAGPAAISVSAEDRTQASSGTVLQQESVSQLPLASNDVMDLINIMEGVVRTEGNIFEKETQTFAGVSGGNVNIQREGITVNEVRYNSGIVSPTGTNQAMAGEFESVLSPVDAEMGRGIGQVQQLFKSSPSKTGDSIAVKEWDPATPYLAKLKQAKHPRYQEIYLQERKAYGNSPAFYLDCADFFFKHHHPVFGLKILSNIAELQLEDPALLRILAHRLAQLGQIKLSTKLFETILKIRPEEPQSYRDLALVLAEQKQYVRAMELLNHVVMTEWDRFEEIAVIALMELNRIIPLARAQGISKIPLDPRLIKLLDVDVRIVLTWDADMTDVDLWVTEPSGEKAFYEHQKTTTGGHVSKDFTEGYGPEEYVIHKALPGEYLIQANYFGSNSPLLQGAVTVHADVYTHYGRKHEKRQRLTLRLKEKEDVYSIGKIKF
jgi:Ca-activated chloride channel homolog